MNHAESITSFLKVNAKSSLVKGILPEDLLSDVLDRLTSELSVQDVDILVVADLDTHSVKDIVEFCSFKPYGELKLVMVNMTGSTAQAQRGLLSLVENPPEYARLALFSESYVLPTLMSRAKVLRVYEQFKPDLATKTKVLKALASTSLGEKKILETALSTWTPLDTEALNIWACERISQRCQMYSSEELEAIGLSESFAKSLLEALGTFRLADSKRVVSAVLMAQLAVQKGVR